jgi:hypothetical protein
MSTAAPVVLDQEVNDGLQYEFCWPSVASGLTKILLSYVVSFIGTVLGLLMIFSSGLFVLKLKQKPGVDQLWMFLGGWAVLGFSGFIAFCMLVAGKWACLMNAPDRHGARGWMLTCIVCIGITFVLNWFGNRYAFQAGYDKGKQRNAKQIAVSDIFKNNGYKYSFIGARVGDIGGGVAFFMFLRAVAQCMGNARLRMLVTGYIGTMAVLTGITTWSIFKINMDYLVRFNEVPPRDMWQMNLLIGLICVWVVMFFVYLFLVIATRLCIINTVSLVRSPLQYSAAADRFALTDR